MAEIRQKMRGTEAELDSATSVIGHLVYNITQKELRLYDGVKVGGYRVMTLDTTKTWLDAYLTGVDSPEVYMAADAQKLNGEPGSFYRDAANLNAGTLPDARLNGDYTFANLTLSGNLDVVGIAATGDISGVNATLTGNLTVQSRAHILLSANQGALYFGPFSGAGNFMMYDAIKEAFTFVAGGFANASTIVAGKAKIGSPTSTLLQLTSNGISATDGGNVQEYPLSINLTSTTRLGTTRVSSLYFTDPLSGAPDWIEYNDTSNTFSFYSDGSVTSSGLLAGGFMTSNILGSDNAIGVRMYHSGSNSYLLSHNDGAAAGIFKRFNSNGDVILFRRTGTTTVGSISVTTSSTTYNTSSDARLKTDLQPIDPALIEQINVYDFEWINEPGARSHGVMAQEAQGIIPNFVSHNIDSYEDENGNPVVNDSWSADYSKLAPLLVAAVKDLRSRLLVLEQA